MPSVRAWWERVSRWAIDATGSPWAFLLALLVVAVWIVTGPIFGWSDTWQLVINTGTTVVTFLMVFLIQHASNRDTKALHVKLNEVIAALEGASNRLIDVEDLSEEDLTRLEQQYQELALRVRSQQDDHQKTGLSDVAPDVDRTLASMRPESDDDRPPGPARGRRGRPSS
jgi:low affinity Fe/Cu permease